MQRSTKRRFNLRRFIAVGLILVAFAALIDTRRGTSAETLVPLDVAYAGSMTSIMNGPIREAAAHYLGIDVRGRAQGSMGLARLIESGIIKPDVFIAVTPGPMRVVLAAHKASRGIPIARTEMVIAYSPKSRFAPQLAASSNPDSAPWWKILEEKGVRFGRTDPNIDPQGLNIIFTMKLAADYYHQPGLATNILGPQLNREQIFQEPEVMVRLQAGQLDAASAYRTQPAAFGLPYIVLPKEINLGDAALEHRYAQVSVNLGGKTIHPAPLVFYAAALTESANKDIAGRFVEWLASPDGRRIFTTNHYDPPTETVVLTNP